MKFLFVLYILQVFPKCSQFFTFKMILLKILILSSCFSSREFGLIVKEKKVLNISSYSWFLLQFWPTHRTASKMLHYNGKFKIRRMVQARLFRKSNPDSHHANAVLKFMKFWSVKNRHNVAFFSAERKCLKVNNTSLWPL